MKNDNDLILERMRGVPMREADWKDKFDPRNPNVPNSNDNAQTYKDPTCPKCGIVLGNKMAYACQHSHCPAGLN